MNIVVISPVRDEIYSLYIDYQKIHHARKPFSEEYIELLNDFSVDYNNRYLFTPVDIDYNVPDGTHTA